MIKLISWRIGLVGFGLPWLGFAFGCLFSKLCRYDFVVFLQITCGFAPSLQGFATKSVGSPSQIFFLN